VVYFCNGWRRFEAGGSATSADDRRSDSKNVAKEEESDERQQAARERVQRELPANNHSGEKCDQQDWKKTKAGAGK